MCFKMWGKRRKVFNLGLFLKITAALLLCVPGTRGFDISSMLSSQKQSISGKLPLPDLKSLVSAETLQKVLQAKALGIPVVSAEVSLPDSKALNELLAKLKPKEGRFDPALLEKLHSSLESINPNRQGPLDMFHRFSHSVDDKTMSNLPTAPTSPATLVLPKRKRGKSKKNKFSAKFRMNQTMVVENPNLAKYNLSSDSSQSHPFSYITDPNLRNHRLYDWEFETYKNFTHIDQAEDLFADESHHSDEIQTAITKTGHSENPQKIQAAGNGWVPLMRDRITPRPRRPPLNPKEPLPASYEDLEEPTTSHSNIHEHAVMPPGVFVRFTPEMENSEPKKRPGLRAPLRASSMENQVYHRNSQIAERRPFYDENNSRPSSENFRPSQPEVRPQLSDPVFIDPDQDFFTSTVRNQNTNRDKSSESGNYNMPPFPSNNKRNRQPAQKDRENTRHRDRINYNKNEHSNKRNKFYSDEYDEKISRLSTKHKSDRILDQQQSSNERDRDRKRLEQSIKKQNYDTNYMSEYLGHTPSSAASDPAMYFDHPESESHNGNNEYSSPGNQLQLFGASLDQSAQQEEQPRPLLADHIYAAGQHHLYHHPYGSHSHQVHYVEDEGGSWYNTFFILGGLVALSALIAFFLPSLLHVSSVGKDVDKIGDVNSDVDLWTEIKGVYKDLVHIVKGDYAYFNNKRYGNVNLTYRNEEDSETTTDRNGDTIEIPRASRRHDKSKSSFNNSSLAYHFSSAPANSTPSILNSSADSFLGEWAKVQLINN